MMKILRISTLLMCWTPLLFCELLYPANLKSEGFADAEKTALHKINEKKYKEAIKGYQELSENASGLKKSEYLKQLAKAYYGDQEQAKAFSTFLEALDSLPLPNNSVTASSKERELYEDALKLYLDPRESDTQMLSLKLRDIYKGIYQLHPDYHSLGYMVAITHANLLEFSPFFDVFFKSYQYLPEHYLAYKTKGILHIKLYERARTLEEKEKERRLIILCLQKAKFLYPLDPSLYHLMIVFSENQDKRDNLEQLVGEILKSEIIIPRSDLSFYFDQLLAYGMTDLASSFLAKAKKWYHYSRVLDNAEELIQEKTTQIKNKEKNGSANIW